jgi:hypothetical protein
MAEIYAAGKYALWVSLSISCYGLEIKCQAIAYAMISQVNFVKKGVMKCVCVRVCVCVSKDVLHTTLSAGTVQW